MSEVRAENTAVLTTPEQQRALERFYHFEARLLDNRQYQQWLALVSPDIQYSMPSRVNVQVDNRQSGRESMLAVEHELESADSLGSPLREETYIHLMLRVERAFKINSWSESPPARTRRIVANIELMSEQGDELQVVSNFLLYYTRPGTQSVLYSGQRRDVLQLQQGDSTADGYRIYRREVIMDYANIELPTLGLLF